MNDPNAPAVTREVEKIVWSGARIVRHKITMSGLLALCGLALLAEHVYGLDSFTGDHLVAGVLMLTLAVLVWCLPSDPRQHG